MQGMTATPNSQRSRGDAKTQREKDVLRVILSSHPLGTALGLCASARGTIGSPGTCDYPQAPVPEAGSWRMDPGQEQLPVERVPKIGRRSAPCEIGHHRFHSIRAVRRKPSGRKWSEHGMVLRASTQMLVRPGGSTTHLG